MTPLSISCITILKNLENAIEQISSQDFSRPYQTLSGASIGQHVRHVIEFFLCLEKGFQSGVINYDNRAHDRSIETNKDRALQTLEYIRSFISNDDYNRALSLEALYAADARDLYKIETNYYRELAYNIEHTVHHMAIIKIALKEMTPGVHLPSDFGVAASTVKHQTRQSEVGLSR